MAAKSSLNLNQEARSTPYIFMRCVQNTLTTYTDKVFFYKMEADGLSLDDKRDPVKENDVPDIVAKYKEFKAGKGNFSDKTAKAFAVDKDDIAKNAYDLSVNRYREVEYEEAEYDPPLVILDKLEALETEIKSDLEELRRMIA